MSDGSAADEHELFVGMFTVARVEAKPEQADEVGGRGKAAVGGLHEGAKRDTGRPEAVHVVVGVEVGSDGWDKVYSA